ncbi:MULTISPECIES: cache domain-containing protein [unclassified Roseateles]|uniref:cache domain-containing protein n=1 Tax=unclassified Roseateles TaxID=2626991 RepID=UPI0009EAF0DB|nr:MULTISPECIES: cache domain-containing protein [unclassified Roseateles]
MLSLGVRAQLVGLAVVCAIPGVLGLGLFAVNTWNGAIDTAHVRSQAVATRVASSLDRGFNEYSYLLGQLANRPAVRALNASACDPLIREYPPLHPELTAITLRDLDSNLICTSLANATKTLGPKEAGLAADGARSGAFKVVAVARGEVSGRTVARMVQPVKNAQGVIAAQLLAPLDLRIYGDRILSDLPESIVVSVFDTEGTILMRSRSARAWDGRPVPAALWKVQDRREGRVRAEDVEGVPRIGAYVTVPASHWIVAASMSEAEALGPHRVATMLAASAALLCFFVAVLAAWFIGRNVSVSIERLIEVTGRVMSGGTSARAAEGGPREIRKLIRCLNGVFDRIDARK